MIVIYYSSSSTYISTWSDQQKRARQDYVKLRDEYPEYEISLQFLISSAKILIITHRTKEEDKFMMILKLKFPNVEISQAPDSDKKPTPHTITLLGKRY